MGGLRPESGRLSEGLFARPTIFADASNDERRALIDHLAENPLTGVEIPGTGAVRKLRFAALGRGKSGGARAIYFHGGEDMPVYALLAYAKSAKTDLTSAERRAVAALAAAIRAAGKERQ